MDSKKLTVSSIFLSVGLLLHYVTPALFMGVKPDFFTSNDVSWNIIHGWC